MTALSPALSWLLVLAIGAVIFYITLALFNLASAHVLTERADRTPELATRPAGADPWARWSPPVRLEREPLPAAATRTREPGLCRCGQPGCSDGAVRR